MKPAILHMKFVPVANDRERSHMTEQGCHRIKDQDAEHTTQRRPQFGFGFQSAPQLAKDLTAALLNLIKQNRQQHQQSQHRRQMLLPVPIVRGCRRNGFSAQILCAMV
ncbi:MAG: hypothetical protein HY231_08980 [Acidobacteria bacterium]|nr:hypothetical protein [Acidobacteriota bacterium]